MMTAYPDYMNVVIANGASLAPVVDLDGDVLVGIIIPAAWTAAGITFSVSPDNVTFYDYYDAAGVEVSITATTSKFIRLNPSDYTGLRFIKPRSGTSGTPVAQGAARTLIFVTKRFGG